MKDSDDGYELMKQIFAESGIAYEEGVPADEVGFYAAKNGVEIRLPVINRGIVMGADSINVKHWAVNPEMR